MHLGARKKAALAVMNVARLKVPLTDPSLQEFQLALEPINLIAQHTPGFVWMYTTGSSDSFAKKQDSLVPELKNDPLLMPQLSLWRDADSLMHFVFKSGHAMYYKRKREWFKPMEAPYTVCWWHLDPDNPPTLDESFHRLRALRDDGETSFSFNLKSAKSGVFPPPCIAKDA